MLNEVEINEFASDMALQVADLLKKNMLPFESDAVFNATFRRINSLAQVYHSEGCYLFTAFYSGKLVACLGLGTFHGLPLAEGVGEIRDLVVEESCRGQGIGARLIELSIAEAKKLGYKRLYLETSDNMVPAQNLFKKKGFRPVKDVNAQKEATKNQSPPCYFLLENLNSTDA